MIPGHRLEQSIPDLTGIAVLIIVVSAFALSFFNLQAAALQAGISPWLSWLWPVCIDALLIAGSLMILRSSLRNESPVIGWSVLISFTAVSTAFNVLHSPEELVSQAAHAVPPVALCVSIELLMMTIRSDLMTGERSGMQLTKQCDMSPCQAGDRSSEQDKVLHEHETRPGDRVPEQSDTTIEQVDNILSKSDRGEQIRIYFDEHPSISVAQAARDLNMSRTTVKRYKPVEPVKEGKPYGAEMHGLCSS